MGVDPLAADYLTLHSQRHAMTYVTARAEAMPLPSEHFDVVSSFNSLDHVDDVEAALTEIHRVTRPGGTFLLLVDLNHGPTENEPHRLEWSLIDRLQRDWLVVSCAAYERPSDNMLENIAAAAPTDIRKARQSRRS